AEDGIRDRTVTGVQTCALPIYRLDDRVDRLRQCRHARRFCERVEEKRNAGARRRDDENHLPPNIHISVGARCEPGYGTASPLIEIGRASCRERGWSWGGEVA